MYPRGVHFYHTLPILTLDFVEVQIFVTYNSYYFTRNISGGGIIYPLRNRIHSGIYPEDHC